MASRFCGENTASRLEEVSPCNAGFRHIKTRCFRWRWRRVSGYINKLQGAYPVWMSSVYLMREDSWHETRCVYFFAIVPIGLFSVALSCLQLSSSFEIQPEIQPWRQQKTPSCTISDFCKLLLVPTISCMACFCLWESRANPVWFSGAICVGLLKGKPFQHGAKPHPVNMMEGRERAKREGEQLKKQEDTCLLHYRNEEFLTLASLNKNQTKWAKIGKPLLRRTSKRRPGRTHPHRFKSKTCYPLPFPSLPRTKRNDARSKHLRRLGTGLRTTLLPPCFSKRGSSVAQGRNKENMPQSIRSPIRSRYFPHQP